MDALQVWAGTYLAIFTAVIVFVLIPSYDADDVRKPCIERGGVHQVQDSTWFSFRGHAAVVCKDGTVHSI